MFSITSLFTALIVLLVVLLFVFAFLLVRTMTFARPVKMVEVYESKPVDSDVVAGHLSSAIRCETYALGEDFKPNASALVELHNLLERVYPRVHAALKREVVGDFSLLYTWQGSQPELPALVFMAHLDVVPADPTSLSQWLYPPFSGEVAEGFVWGRGTIDCKHQVIGLMEAVEGLLKIDYCPRRSVYLVFGHNEETGGNSGAGQIVALLQERGVQVEVVLDEGGTIADGMLPGIQGPVALISNAEKGVLNLELSVTSEPGHSARPPAQTAIGILAAGLARLEANPMPPHFSAVHRLYKNIGTSAPIANQFAFANLWLFKNAVQRILEGAPNTNALIHTTAAITVIQGGVRPNILPAQAKAIVNIRLMPEDRIAGVCEHVRRAVNDPRVNIEAIGGAAWEASPYSAAEGSIYQELEISIRQVFGNIPVAPYLLAGGTDSRRFQPLCSQIYRFSPIITTSDDIGRMHGINERIPIASFEKMIMFYGQIIQAWDKTA
jgi:carboxypeptidase PM20D1